MTNKVPTLADAEKYLNHKYVEGEFDCGSLTVLVQKELFGRAISIPHAAERSRGARHQAMDLERYQRALAELVAQPQTGDAVVMWSTEGKAAPPLNRRWHVGTAFVQNSEIWVLHLANEKRGAAIQKLSSMEQQGLRVDAFYSWKNPKTTELVLFPRPGSSETKVHYCPHGTTLAELLSSNGILPNTGWRVTVGDKFVPNTMWARTRVRHGVKVTATARAKKQVVAIVAMLVLAYFTFGVGLGAYGGIIMTSYGYVGAMAVYVAGSMLISKYLGPKPASMGSMDNMQPPPTYSLSDGRNRARLWQALSMVFGKTKAIPDKGNNGYVWYEGEDQYYSAIFQAGINCASVEDIRIGETLITAYEGVTIRRYGFPTGNDGDPPAIGTSVDSVPGGVLDNPATNPEAYGEFVTRTTSAGTVRFELDLEGAVQNMNSKGKWILHSLNLEIRYRPVGSPGQTGWISQFETITNMGPKPIRRTLGFDVPEGQYEVAARKLNKNSTGDGNDQRMQNNITWNVLKSYQPDRADYGGQPRVEIRIKASGQLNGALDEVNWIATANTMPLWTGSEWVNVSHEGADGISNPGAIILMLLRGLYRPTDGRRIAGVGFVDSRIDMESLQGFMVRCRLMNFRFDFFLQEEMNMQQLLESVASAGMATLTRQNSGRIGVVWFAEDQPIEGIINMTNMRTDEDTGVKSEVVSNFSVQYDLVRTADEFELEYFDRNRDYSWQPIRVVAPGVVTPQRTSSENVRGVTTEAQAAMLARFIMAQNLYGRKTIAFDMALDFMDMKRGAVFSLSHDLTQWGHGGRLFAIHDTPGGFVLTLDEPANEPLTAPDQRTIGLKLPGERQMRVFPVSSVSPDRTEVTILQEWPNENKVPGVHFAVHDVLYIYDFKATPGARVRIVSIQPSSNSEYASITCSPEYPEFWQYVLTGEYVPPPDNSSLVSDLPVASNLSVTRGKVLQSGSWVHQLTATFEVRGNYDHAQLWAAPVGAPLVVVDASVFGLQVSWIVPSDNTWNVEIRPFDSLGRPGTKASYIYADPPEAVDGVTQLSVNPSANGIVVRWAAPTGVSAVGWATTQVRVGLLGATWETANLVFDGKADTFNLGWLAAEEYLIFVAHFNDAGDFSAPVVVPFEVRAPNQPVITDDSIFEQIQIEWEDCTTTQPMREYEIRIGPLYASAPVKTSITALGYVYTPPESGLYRLWITAIDVAGNRSATGTVEVETVPTINQGIEDLQQGLDNAVQDILNNSNALTAVEGTLAGVQDQVDALNAQLADLVSAPDHTTSQAYLEGEVVKSGGRLYVAKQDVPIGIAITNTTYWKDVGAYASLGDAVAAHAILIADNATRITLTEQGLVAEAQDRSLLATQLRGGYTGTDPNALTQGLAFNERQARVAGDAANASLTQGVRADLTALTAPGGVVAGHATAINTLTARVELIDDDLVATGNRLDVVEAGVLTGGAEDLVVDPGMSSLATSWATSGGMTLFAASDAGVPAGAPSPRVVRVQVGVTYNHYRRLRDGAGGATSAIRVTPGEIIDVSVWVYLEAAANNETVLQAVRGTTDSLTSTANLQVVTVANAWVQLRGSYTIPAGITHLGLRMRRSASTVEGVAWYCGFQAERRGAGVAIVNAAVIAEANTRANAIAAEATARQIVAANLGYDNLLRNPTYNPAGDRQVVATGSTLTDYILAAAAPVGSPAANVMRRVTAAAAATNEVIYLIFANGTDRVPATANELFDISVWIYCDPPTTGRGLVMANTLNAAGASLGTPVLIAHGLTGGWKRHTFTYTTPANTANLRILFAQGPGAAGFTAYYALPEVRRRSAEGTILAASVTATSQAVAELGGKVAASYTLSVVAGGKVAGVRVGVDGAVSDFVVLADKFAWTYSTLPGEVKYGLVLGLVNGVASFGFSGNMFVDGTLQARMIGADQIRAVHIRTDEIVARHMSAGSVTARSLAVGVSANMVQNASLITTEGWAFENHISGASVIGTRNYPDSAWHPVGGNALCSFQNDAVGAGSSNTAIWFSPRVPVVAGERYGGSAYVAAHRCTADAYISFADAAGAWVGDGFAGEQATNVSGGQLLSGYKRIATFAVAPAGAAYAQIVFRKFPTALGNPPPNNNSYAWMTHPMIERAGASQTVPSAWTLSGQGTLVTPEGIKTNNLAAISADVGLLRTATSGGRMEIYSNTIKSFDDSNQKRAQFGNLLL